jgi:hypothetical protein
MNGTSHTDLKGNAEGQVCALEISALCLASPVWKNCVLKQVAFVSFKTSSRCPLKTWIYFWVFSLGMNLSYLTITHKIIEQSFDILLISFSPSGNGAIMRKTRKVTFRTFSYSAYFLKAVLSANKNH